jgi:hypothetical protein
MKDDYLWDGTGKPDAEIQRLETALGRFRHDRPAPEFPEIARSSRRLPRPRVLPMWLAPRWLAMAATVLLLVAGGYLVRRLKPTPASRPGWDVARLAGTPHVGAETIGETSGTRRLGIGQILETDSGSRASIKVAEIGQVDVEPDTRLRLLGTSARQKHLALDRGTIHASIWAPPGEFVVDTPSAVAVDLGCAYTLHVDDSGAGLLRTTLGWVGFKLEGHESFIPAGAACATRPGIGPGTPYFEDAPEPLRAALSKLDFEAGMPEQRSAGLNVVLTQSRKRDALTLWHLLARVSGSERDRVFGRLAALVPPPPGVTREGILGLDQRMLDLWWNELGLGDISVWRTWERSWSQRENSGKE